MAEQITLWWRDIPAQVNGRDGRKRTAAKLPERFEKAIDRAAMRARLIGTDQYLQEWRRTTLALETAEDLEQTIQAEATRLEQVYDDARLEQLIQNGGFEEKPESDNKD